VHIFDHLPPVHPFYVVHVLVHALCICSRRCVQPRCKHVLAQETHRMAVRCHVGKYVINEVPPPDIVPLEVGPRAVIPDAGRQHEHGVRACTQETGVFRRVHPPEKIPQVLACRVGREEGRRQCLAKQLLT